MFTVRRYLPLLTLLPLLGGVAWSWLSGGIIHDLFAGDVDATTRVEMLRQFFESFGAIAPLVYVSFVVTEVVLAPIPGLMLYAPAGILFGPLLGGTLSLIGNTIGAGIACSVTRTFGRSWLNSFFDEGKLEQVQAAIESRGSVLIVLLRMNPLTSSDIVSYAAGFSRLPVWKVMLATAIGMTPLSFGQAWLAESLITAYPRLVYPLVIACFLYLVVVAIILNRIITEPAQSRR